MPPGPPAARPRPGAPSGRRPAPAPPPPAAHTAARRFAMAQDLLETVTDGVAVLTLNRPDRLNAMSVPMLDALLAALPRLAPGPPRRPGEKAEGLRARMEVSRWLHELPKPTIAIVRGAAAGAGLSLALACDLRIASDSARFGTAFARVGYPGGFGGSLFLAPL